MSGEAVGEWIEHMRSALLPLARRNLKIALELKPSLVQLKEKFGFTPRMSAEEYVDWRASNAREIAASLNGLLRGNLLLRYQLPIIDWLFDASDTEIDELTTYCSKPEGPPPRAYYILCAPAYRFGPPTSVAWPEETGYQTVVLVQHEEGYWGLWGDLHGISEDVRWSLLQKSGDFIVRGNMELFDVESWKRIGKTLSALKKESHMGERLGLVPGGRKGRKKAEKRILGDMKWPDIRSAVAQNPKQYNQLCNQYASARLEEFRAEYPAGHNGQSAPAAQLKKVKQAAIRNFSVQVRRARQK